MKTQLSSIAVVVHATVRCLHCELLCHVPLTFVRVATLLALLGIIAALDRDGEVGCTLSDCRCYEGLSNWLCDRAKAPRRRNLHLLSSLPFLGCASLRASGMWTQDQDDPMSSLGGTVLSSIQTDPHTVVRGHGIS
ncbi:hypothetical protein C8Q76DRAFT_747897 [Earliella scabrosa]|nr:hypothetical protein C8Q76DRAFT_747897 [Earliella scabrosa]